MERAATLIDKLKEQFERGEDAEKMLVTVQMLYAELKQSQQMPATKGKVSVVLPNIMPPIWEEIIQELQPKIAEETKPIIKEEETPQQEKPQNGWMFDAVEAIPTLAHQSKREIFELNDTVANSESLNEKLKQGKTEISHVLQDSPVRDLRKAIGLNDKYLFINELFRGDEIMYERSIKTINAFNMYPEAEYWIQRELKTKIGWSNENETVKLFDQLVKRRFC
jgi:hypothetical protein